MNRKNMQSYQMLTRTVEFATNHVGSGRSACGHSQVI